MAKTIRLQGTQVMFPDTCIVCSKPANEIYDLDKIFTYGQNSTSVRLPVPICELHYKKAATKSPGERLCGWIGLVAGIVTGLLVFGGLMAYWSMSGQGNGFLNLLIAAFTSLGFFLIVWLTTLYWLAPSFATAEAKPVRNSLRLTRYWPQQDMLELMFANEQMANFVARENAANILA